MKKTMLAAAILVSSATVGIFATEETEARKVLARGQINGPVVMSCSNGMRESWTTYHAPGDHSFFNQEVVLGEGDYTLSLIPNGNFRFNAFVYEGDGKRYVGGRQNVGSYSHRFSVRSWSGQNFLIQMKKTQQTCQGCAVTMVLTGRNCASNRNGSNSGSNAPMCKPNQCADPRGGLFGLPSCLYKKGARGGYCGTPGN